MLGPLTLPNTPVGGWPEFYATRRLEPLARMASDRGALPAAAGALLDRLIGRLDDLWGAAEPPARLHGDLWSANVLTGADGRPLADRSRPLLAHAALFGGGWGSSAAAAMRRYAG